jgi:NitT/TauT family transport system ATP-binding protein
LADRIVVMTYRPGTIKKIVNVTMPRPRDPSSVEFNELKKELSLLVMEEQSRHNQHEIKLPVAD